MKRIWVNGCFDILHEGHLNLLEYAASLGELYVGIDSDSRVKELKGNDRPIHSQLFRWRMMNSLKYVKECYIFSTDTELENIISVSEAQIIVIGEDYKNKRIIGYSPHKHKICFYPHTIGFSTSNIIENIKK